ncbi:MAG: hypothetical protein K6G18_13975 [Treponema sp.]|nr:hypothetical protein [Treponema sp.]
MDFIPGAGISHVFLGYDGSQAGRSLERANFSFYGVDSDTGREEKKKQIIEVI